MFDTVKKKLPRPRRNFRTCGGFFDVAALQNRLAEINALMATDNFWNNREKAQGLMEEASSLRAKIEPLAKTEKQLDDFRVMLELGEAEPPEAQPQIEQESPATSPNFSRNSIRWN